MQTWEVSTGNIIRVGFYPDRELSGTSDTRGGPFEDLCNSGQKVSKTMTHSLMVTETRSLFILSCCFSCSICTNRSVLSSMSLSTHRTATSHKHRLISAHSLRFSLSSTLIDFSACSSSASGPIKLWLDHFTQNIHSLLYHIISFSIHLFNAALKPVGKAPANS